MKRLFIAVLLVSLAIPSFARTDSGSKNGSQKSNDSHYNNPNNRGNCYYCWKDLSLDYTPSRHKYAKKL
jgi:hypothetical protein